MVVWWQCLFEIFMVLLLGCAFEIIMTPSEEESFEAALLTDFDSIRTRISKIDVKNANAFEKADKDHLAAREQ